MVQQEYSSYGCPGGSHTWDSSACTGLQMGKGNTWTMTLPAVTLMNQMFYLDMRPWTNAQVPNSLDVDSVLQFTLSLYGADSDVGVEGGSWHAQDVIVDGVSDEIAMLCFWSSNSGSAPRSCLNLKILEVPSIEYEYYHVEVSLLPQDGYSFVGDVVFNVCPPPLFLRASMYASVLMVVVFFCRSLRRSTRRTRCSS